MINYVIRKINRLTILSIEQVLLVNIEYKSLINEYFCTINE